MLELDLIFYLLRPYAAFLNSMSSFSCKKTNFFIEICLDKT